MGDSAEAWACQRFVDEFGERITAYTGECPLIADDGKAVTHRGAALYVPGVTPGDVLLGALDLLLDDDTFEIARGIQQANLCSGWLPDWGDRMFRGTYVHLYEREDD